MDDVINASQAELDEAFDMYCEDVDLSLKARQLNRNIIYAPKSVILHNVSQSLGEHSSEKNFMKIVQI